MTGWSTPLAVVYGAAMGSWFLVLSLSFLVVFFGLYIHWTVVLLGALMPFLPVLSALRERRARGETGRRPSHGEKS